MWWPRKDKVQECEAPARDTADRRPRFAGYGTAMTPDG
jgi:hypothetical protein